MSIGQLESCCSPCFVKKLFRKAYSKLTTKVWEKNLRKICFKVSEMKTKRENKFYSVCLKVDLNYISINSVDCDIGPENYFLPLFQVIKESTEMMTIHIKWRILMITLNRFRMPLNRFSILFHKIQTIKMKNLTIIVKNWLEDGLFLDKLKLVKFSPILKKEVDLNEEKYKSAIIFPSI